MKLPFLDLQYLYGLGRAELRECFCSGTAASRSAFRRGSSYALASHTR